MSIDMGGSIHYEWHHSLGLGPGLCKSGEGKVSPNRACVHFSLLWMVDENPLVAFSFWLLDFPLKDRSQPGVVS